jgi:hypothetical protein
MLQRPAQSVHCVRSNNFTERHTHLERQSTRYVFAVCDLAEWAEEHGVTHELFKRDNPVKVFVATASEGIPRLVHRLKPFRY